MPFVIVRQGNKIGFRSYQKSQINIEAKLLMLTHAFEVMHLNRVELLTDYLNTTSRNAIFCLGAKQEGIIWSCLMGALETLFCLVLQVISRMVSNRTYFLNYAEILDNYYT